MIASKTDGPTIARLRVVCLVAPPERYENAVTTFGLQDKQQALRTGQGHANGATLYECDVRVSKGREMNTPRTFATLIPIICEGGPNDVPLSQ